MKKIIIALCMTLLSLSAYAQRQTPEQMLAAKPKDWGGFARYAEANQNYTGNSKVLFYGDSITDFWINERPDFFSSNNFIDRGISGQTVEQMLVRFQQDVVGLNPKIMVFLGGINDIAMNQGPISLENVVNCIKSICELCKVHDITPIICSVMPCDRFFWAPFKQHPAPDVIKLNSMIKEYVESQGITYVDYHSQFAAEDGSLPMDYTKDGCHPNAAGYEKMESIILPVVRQTAEQLGLEL